MKNDFTTQRGKLTAIRRLPSNDFELSYVPSYVPFSGVLDAPIERLRIRGVRDEPALWSSAGHDITIVKYPEIESVEVEVLDRAGAYIRTIGNIAGREPRLQVLAPA